MSLQNPFSEAREQANPYASPPVSPSLDDRPNPLFLPAIILLPVAICWELYVLITFATVFVPEGPFANLDPMIRTELKFSYLLMLVANGFFIAGTVAMLRLRSKSLAWTACVIGLVPLFGPCMGLTIPLAIWCLVLLRRPGVGASFSS